MIELLLSLIFLVLLAICYKLYQPGKPYKSTLSFKIEGRDLVAASKRGGENRPLKY